MPCSRNDLGGRKFRHDPWHVSNDFVHAWHCQTCVSLADKEWFGDFSSSRFQPGSMWSTMARRYVSPPSCRAWTARTCKLPSKTAPW
ncbi:hypothetical protein CBM2609_A70470 [Cupriavidus taiwanensis]|nr:hypothetical protein CBM2604_A60468 [Cupriavidus taiwanensis]SOZ29177.1 hypothetical protein CBM2609_A70470 [Cupriavidus taiwanensis]SOZ46637.1 hypothetical protein CBM2610_A80424 [Cupriavidus taiwanensis]